jgi:hypothetical protein
VEAVASQGGPRTTHHRRRWLIALAVVLGILLLAGVGLVVWWNQRGPSKPSISGALDQFRSSSTAPGAQVAMRPTPGVYIYAGTGSEKLSFLSTHQSQDGNLPGTVTSGRDGCWTFAIQYNSFHRQTWHRCVQDGRLVERGDETDQKFDFGALSESEHTTVTCTPPKMIYDPSAAPGSREPLRCTGRSQTTKANMTQRGTITFVGPTTVLVAGARVPALHYSQSITISGDQSGTQHEEFWLAAADGLPLREERTISVDSPAPAPLNEVTYTEHGSWHLTSLTPRT